MTRHPRRRAATFTVGYICACVVAVLIQSAFARLDEAESSAADAASVASDAFSKAEQNESDISDLQSAVENIQSQLEYR